MPLIFKIVFKNDSPLGFMIDDLFKKWVQQGVKMGSHPRKMSFTLKKMNFTYDLPCFYDFYQKS